jgi:hypothetical protein
MRTQEGKTAFIAVYIDNCTIITPNDQIDNIKSLLHQGFHMKYLGPARLVLGLKALQDQDAGALYLCQAGKIQELSHDFGLTSAKPVYTPMDPGLQLPQLKQTSDDNLKLPYQSAVSRLSYIALMTRPDIAYTVNILSRHINTYRQEHWEAAKHMIRYLKTTIDLAICYQALKSEHPINNYPLRFVDADWGGDQHSH